MNAARFRVLLLKRLGVMLEAEADPEEKKSPMRLSDLIRQGHSNELRVITRADQR